MKVAVVVNELWWTRLLPSLLKNHTVRRLVVSSDGRDLRTLLYFVVQRPHPLVYKVRICDASTSWLGLPTRPRARAGVHSVGVVQPSDNVGWS